MKIVKWLMLVVLSAVLLLTFYLTFLFDLNDIKQNIIDKVAAETGRKLEIRQDIGWSLYPDLALTLAEVSLSQPAGLPGPPMLQVAEIQAAVALWPLFDKQIQLKKLSLQQADIFITAQGELNSWHGLTDSANNSSPAKTATAKVNPLLAQLQLDALELHKVQLTLQAEGKPPQQLRLQQFSMQQFQPDKASALQFQLMITDMLDIRGEAMLLWQPASRQLRLDPLQLTGEVVAQDVRIQSALELNSATQLLQWQLNTLTIGQSQGQGAMTLNYAGNLPELNAQLALDQWQLAAADTKDDKVTAQQNQQQPDLSWLKQFDFQLALQVNQLQLNQLQLHNSKLQLHNQHGVLSLKQASAALYQGNVSATGALDARQPVATYQLNAKLSDLDVLALLKAAADMELLSGTAALELSAKGQGLLRQDVQTALQAQGKFNISDGAINGINIPAQIRSARAAFKNEADPGANEAKKTDFSSLTGSFTLSNAVLEQQDLQLAAPLLRLSGSGSADLGTEQLDYRLKTALVNTLKGQGGKNKDELANIEIPLKISGSFRKPTYQLDTKALFEQHLKQKVEVQKDKLKNKLLEKLGGG